MSLAILFLALTAQETDWPEQPINPTIAVRTFVATCWRGLRNPETFETAIQGVAPELREVPKNDGRRFTSPEVDINYDSNSRCAMRFRIETEMRGMELADDLGKALSLRTPERQWTSDASPPQAFWWFRGVPIDGGYYTLSVYVREAQTYKAVDPVEVEFFVSNGFGRR